MSTARRIGALALAGLALALGGCGCGGARRAPAVVVLGIDGLPLPLLTGLVAQGVLPNFARVCRRGNVGGVSVVHTGMPPLSPRVWTTFATGQLPAVHGVRDFVTGDGEERRLTSSLDRRAPALWEIASAGGMRVGVVNWLVTYPAEPVNGFMITDRYLPAFGEVRARYERVPLERDADRLVHPPALLPVLARLDLPPQAPVATTAKAGEANDRAVFALAWAALEAYPVDLLMIYTRSMDEVGHVAWHTHEPLPGEPPVARDEVVEFLRRYDVLLGELLARLDRASRLVILSDHGMERNREGKGLSGSHVSEATAVGAFVLHGPGILQGAHVGADALAVAPTVLELLGVPPARDMPGAVHVAALAQDHVALPRGEPYRRRAAAGEGVARPDDAAVLERLRALGYVQ